MSFVVSARKYRPRNFDELIGQDHIATTLKNAIRTDKLAHAFLFSGPRGVGKTTSARILAKVLNCENLSDDYHACGTCNSCTASEQNASFNIFELDAASNNSVDHIRSLNDQVRFQPQQGSYKIYIIDEVHMLSQAAFNAFLKTLEEPPPYAKFILATTEKHKIIPTILSRCQIFDFRRIQVKDIVHQLKEIASKEDRNIDDEALHLVAQKADGAMRDALSIYDKIVSSVEGDIGYKEVAENLNVLDHDYYFNIVDGCIKEDLSSLMVVFDDIIKKGFETEQFALGFMEHLRQLLFVKDIQTASLLECGEKLQGRYENQAALSSSSFLLTALSIMDKVGTDLYRSQNKRLTVEIALSKIAYMNRAVAKKKTASVTTAIQGLAKNIDPANIPQSNSTRSTAEAVKEKLEPKEERVENTNKIQVKSSSVNETIHEKVPVKEKLDEQAAKPIKISRTVKVAPTISADIGQLLASIEEEEETKKNQTNPYTAEHIFSIIKRFSEKSESKSFKTAVNFIEIQLDGDTITIKTPSEIYVDLIRLEYDMIEAIHGEYLSKELIIKYIVDISAFPNYETPQTPKIVTTMDKIELFKQKNADFEDLMNTFKLKPLK